MLIKFGCSSNQHPHTPLFPSLLVPCLFSGLMSNKYLTTNLMKNIFLRPAEFSFSSTIFKSFQMSQLSDFSNFL